MAVMNIQELSDLRKNVCTCKGQYLTPAFHPDSCPYHKQGEAEMRRACVEHLTSAQKVA